MTRGKVESKRSAEEELASHLTDLGNAARFARRNRGRLLHSPATDWLAYDGKRWRPAGPDVMRAAKGTVRSIYAEAGKTSSAEMRKQVATWAKASEAIGRVRAMVDLAASELPVDPAALDSDPWLLNVQNGTLDLRTSELQEHDPADLLTKVAGVQYDPEARSELWDAVLGHALPDPEVRHFFQKLAGYSLAGATGEDVFVLVYGPTRTSKGTVMDALATSLGDYAVSSELDLLAERDRAGSPRPELVRLRGARMVAIYETSRRLRLSASLVKTLAGSDPITARELYRAPVTFTPQATIWLGTNHPPQAPADDDALWQRVRLVPFDVQLSEGERDRTVRSRLREAGHGTAVLAWAVEGCLLWQAEGLAQPDAVRKAGRAYRTSQDDFARFIEACCLVGPNLWVPTAGLRHEYAKWCEEEGETPADSKALGAKLREFGCEPAKRSGARGWAGIGLLGDHLQAVAPSEARRLRRSK